MTASKLRQSNARRLQWFSTEELTAELERRAPEGTAAEPAAEKLAEVVTYLQDRRRDTLCALRATTGNNVVDYWRWQGHAELSRQLLERLGAEVPQ